MASEQTAESNWCTDSEIRVDLFSFFFFTSKSRILQEERKRRGEQEMRGWEEGGGKREEYFAFFQSAGEILYSLLTLAS